MRESDFRHLQEWGYDLHGCFRGQDGHCYYLVSKEPEVYARDHKGRVFHAYVGADDDEAPDQVFDLQFYVSQSALGTGRVKSLIGDYDRFIVKKGLEHLKAFIDEGQPSGTVGVGIGGSPIGGTPIMGGSLKRQTRTIELTTKSADQEFEWQELEDVTVSQSALRVEILRTMLSLHVDQNLNDMARSTLFKYLCSEPPRVDRVLKSLVHELLVEEVPRGKIRLTPAGDNAAQEVALQPASAPSAQDNNASAAIKIQIEMARESGERLLRKLLEEIEKAPDLSEDDDQPIGIGHNKSPIALDEFREVVEDAAAAFAEPEPKISRLAEPRRKLAEYLDIYAKSAAASTGQKTPLFLGILVAYLSGVLPQFDQLMKLLEMLQ